jgi:hypothetical protein
LTFTLVPNAELIKNQKNRMTKKWMNWLMLAALFAFFAACQSEEQKNARVEVWLTDAPGNYEKLNINIQDVQVHREATDDGTGWISLNVAKGTYNLLKLTNGLDTLLGDIELPAGRISQIRLILGNNNTVVVDGKEHALNTPSAQQSGLKLQIQQTLTEGVGYKILLDFDVARSVVQTGNGKFNLKPVIRTIVEATSGAIKGVVDPKESNPAVYAINGQDTVGTTYPDSVGHFLLRGIPSGNYSVHFIPASGFAAVTKDAVTVQTGVVTDLGTIQISN